MDMGSTLTEQNVENISAREAWGYAIDGLLLGIRPTQNILTPTQEMLDWEAVRVSAQSVARGESWRAAEVAGDLMDFLRRADDLGPEKAPPLALVAAMVIAAHDGTGVAALRRLPEQTARLFARMGGQ